MQMLIPHIQLQYTVGIYSISISRVLFSYRRFLDWSLLVFIALFNIYFSCPKRGFVHCISWFNINYITSELWRMDLFRIYYHTLKHVWDAFVHCKNSWFQQKNLLLIPARCLSLQEYQSKKLMTDSGVSVQKFVVCSSLDEAKTAAKNLSNYSLPVFFLGAIKVCSFNHLNSIFEML